ncbi:MAG: hypothetical protein ABUS49_07685 [Acidobacteriota bacterium]
MRDRYFVRYPFEKWKAEGASAQIRWSSKVFAPRLSVHQRLVTRIDMQLDVKETVKRRSRGEMVAFIEITDSEGRLWRSHDTFDLSRIPAEAKAQPILYSQSVFLRPGEYRLALAVCDSETLEHSFVTRAVHIAPLHNDPLRDAWRDLPAVEFTRNFDVPDSWFQPSVRGRLYLPLATARPVHIDLVMNMSASDRVAGSVRVFRRNMSVLVPVLKLLSGIAVRDGTLDVTVLDLARQTGWEQTGAHGLDWGKMREPLADTNPGVIDAQSLGGKAAMLQFFRDRVVGKVTAVHEREPLRIVIVLSAPLFLENQFKAGGALPRDPNRRIFYVRCRSLRVLPDGATGGQVLAPAIASDDLEHVVKSLDGRILDVITPEQFRRALAGILLEVSRMS